jgi:hypothetical protein
MGEDQPLTTTQKADFGRLYTEPDPRLYFQTLVPLGYQVPRHALPIARTAHRRCGGSVLDVCCSYGINGALLRHDVEFDSLATRYADPALRPLSTSELVASDRSYFARRRRPAAPAVLGLDTSAPAIEYATSVGTLSQGWAEDLESAPPSSRLIEGLSSVRLILCTGGVGYIGPLTFSRLLQAVPAPRRLWLVVFVLRVFSYEPIMSVLAGYDLTTERVPDLSVRQRRFVDDEEQAAAEQDVRSLGLDPSGKESSGWYYADCFLTRPRDR